MRFRFSTFAPSYASFDEGKAERFNLTCASHHDVYLAMKPPGEKRGAHTPVRLEMVSARRVGLGDYHTLLSPCILESF
jgi:hypothetical protein